MSNPTKIMRRMTATFFLAIALVPAAIGAPNTGSCSAGKLVDVQVETQIIQVGTTEYGQEKRKKNGKKEYYSYSMPTTQNQTIYTVTVQLDDIIYTAQSEAIFGFGFRPTSLVVNDPIQGCIQGNTLALTRPDGKEYKAHIVRAVRRSLNSQS